MHIPHSPTGTRWANLAVVVGFGLLVAGGSRVAFFLSSTMMTSVALVGAWLMFTAGIAYAGVRIRPRIGVALLAGVAIGAVLTIVFGGIQVMS